jgi:phosphopantothenoylcysteine decarboxylase/phosphopantothenate--cysteine ligase
VTDEIPRGFRRNSKASAGQPGLVGTYVVLGVCGSISAYKAAVLCRRLVDEGAHVAPVMTADAARFIGSATLSALASEPVHDSLWLDADPIPHTALGRSADVVLVAPATATLLAKYAAGLADDLLTAILLATRAPVIVCPAMHAEMWEHPATVDNVARLRRRGVHVVEPEAGRLAGGDVGPGRLADTDVIVGSVVGALGRRELLGRRVLVTAGGTREPIDPVRFLGNRSTGKQGEAVAAEAAARGAAVVLVTASDRAGPAGVETVRVETAAEMEEAVLDRSGSCDVVVMAAAVADFRPKAVATEKLPKADGPPELVLEPTTDILKELGRRRRPGQVLVGFAAETGDPRRAAEAKLAAKHVDLIVANDVTATGAGFGHDTNVASILDAGGRWTEVPLGSKRELASRLLDLVAAILRTGPAGGPPPHRSGLGADQEGEP